MKFKEVRSGSRKAVGIEIPLPKAPLVMLIGRKGFLMCGYLDLRTAEKLKVAAGVIRGVRSVADLLKGRLAGATGPARRLGLRAGLTGRRALQKLV